MRFFPSVRHLARADLAGLADVLRAVSAPLAPFGQRRDDCDVCVLDGQGEARVVAGELTLQRILEAIDDARRGAGEVSHAHFDAAGREQDGRRLNREQRDLVRLAEETAPKLCIGRDRAKEDRGKRGEY
jgi:hypothetical protein